MSRILSAPTTVSVVSSTSALQTAALGLASNTFVEFSGNGLAARVAHPASGNMVNVLEDGRDPNGYQVLGYSGAGNYDPTSRRVLWMGTGASSGSNQNWAAGAYRWNTRPIFNELTNAWTADRSFRAPNEGTDEGAIGHQYDSNCINVAGRRMYKYRNYHAGIYVYNLDTGAMENNIPVPSGLNTNNWWCPMEFIPTRGAAGALWLWAWPSGVGNSMAMYEYNLATSTWTQIIGTSAFAGILTDPDYGPVMRYNPRAFGGAGGVLVAGYTGARLVRCDTLVVTSIGFGPGTPDMQAGYNSGLCRNPAGDGWLQFHNASGRVWRYSFASGWENRAPLPAFLSAGTPQNFIAVPIDTYGVAWLVSHNSGSPKAALYRP